MSRAFWTFLGVIGLALFLMLMAGVQGGWWAAVAVAYITLGIAALDEFTAFDLAEDGAQAEARVLSISLGIVHFLVLYGTVFAIAFTDHSVLAKIALFSCAGLYLGQVSNSNAHELIHAPDRLRRYLGRWNYITLLYGHHATAHPGVHHVHVATPMDPNSSRLNEGYWKFLPRCWIGGWRAGLALEVKRLRQKGLSPWHDQNPYYQYVAGGIFSILAVYLVGDLTALWIFLALCFFAQSQLIVSDYVQHYGLRRSEIAPGKYEPLGPEHSWDAPHWASSALMLNAPRHADHHLHPGRGFEALTLPTGSPRLPHPLPVMAVLALWPAMWRRIMKPRAQAAMEQAQQRRAALE